MSYSRDAQLVYGFPAPKDLWERLKVLGYDHLDDWLEKEDLRPAEQMNVGKHNGGGPNAWFFIGVELAQVHDFERSDGYEEVKRTEPTSRERTAVARAAMALEYFGRPALYIVGTVS